MSGFKNRAVSGRSQWAQWWWRTWRPRVQGMKLHKKLAGSKICGLAAALEALPCPSLPGNALDPNADIGSRGSPGGQTAGSLQSPRMSAGGAGDVPTAHSRLAGTRLGAQVPAVTAPTHISVAPTPAADEGATGESEPGRSGTASTVPQGSPSVERASGGAHKSRTLQKAAAAPRPPESAVYDPPSKAPAGKDVTRKFPSGLAHFWCGLLLNALLACDVGRFKLWVPEGLRL